MHQAGIALLAWLSAHPEIVIWIAVSVTAWIWHFVASKAASGSVRWAGVLKLMQSLFGDLPKAQEAIAQIVLKKLPPLPVAVIKWTKTAPYTAHLANDPPNAVMSPSGVELIPLENQGKLPPPDGAA